MTLFVLDTDTLTLFRSGNSEVVRRVNNTSPDELTVTVISVEEQLTGWYKLLRKGLPPARLAEVYLRLSETVQFYSGLNVLNNSESAILHFERLWAMKLNVGKNDLRIAAIALENDATVVTRNTRDFERVPDLRIENWAE